MFISVTRLRIRALKFMPGFFRHALRSNAQVRKAAGFRGGSLLADRKLTFWTLTGWDGMESMRAYMTAGAHRTAMPKLIDWCDQASVVHWEQEDAPLPSWPDAERRMRAEGRPSKLRNPSAGHHDLTFAPARMGGAGAIRARAPSQA